MKRVFIGEVGVDSGQLMLCDPCYIESEWQNEPFEDVRIYQHKKSGKRLQYRVHFQNYEQIIPEYSLTMNQLNATGQWEKVKSPAPGTFSYNGCCKATLSKEQAGQLHFKMGHAGAGVAFSTAYGDGVYPVYAVYDAKGNLKSVEVKF